jgi:hypothetical protein
MTRPLIIASVIVASLAIGGVHAGWAQDAPAKPGTAAQQVDSLQERLRAQPDMMEAIAALHADPDVQAALRPMRPYRDPLPPELSRFALARAIGR